MKLTVPMIKLILTIANFSVCMILYYGAPSNPGWLLAAYFVFALVFYGLWFRMEFFNTYSSGPAVEVGQDHGLAEEKES